jgi:hypothetical protein
VGLLMAPPKLPPIMNSKILSFACLSLLAILLSDPMAVAVEPEPPVPASVVAADRDFLNALENGAAVTPAPAQPAQSAQAAPTRAVTASKKSSSEVNREEVPKKPVTAKTKAPKTKRTATARKPEAVEVRRAIPVERATVVTTTTVTRSDRDDDEEGGWEESDDQDGGFLSRLFSR